MSRKLLVSILLTAATLLPVDSLLAQVASPTTTNESQATAPTISDQDIQLLRQDLRDQKKQIVAANMTLTPAEAEKFWPVYEQYTAETTKLGNERYATIKEYAQAYPNLSNTQANSLMRQLIASDESAAQLRQKYVPIFEKVISPTKTALFFQIDRRIAMMIDLQLASQIPLVPAK
jgi:hypothetical protein